ncbi:C-X-C motif chemokine 2-like [Notamacropus eugenii]|uniref:C-X-C motif chemokine 2-like n=1 Tax=Notamacropus eugenii TaxID=9315 RepID=UPI003B67CD38
MALAAVCLLFGLLMAIANSSGQAPIVPEIRHENHSCLCLKLSSKTSLYQLPKVVIIPPEDGCNKSELMFLLKGNKKVCMDPKSNWIHNVLHDLVRLSAISTKMAFGYGYHM